MICMRQLTMVLTVVYLSISDTGADVLITNDGDELIGKIVSTDASTIRFLPEDSNRAIPDTLKRTSVFMLKYDDGHKVVIKAEKTSDAQPLLTDDYLYAAAVTGQTGLFGLVNINENVFDPGVVTLGVTPRIERKINRFLSVGGEYMILWAKAKRAEGTRFIMNCNALGRLSFPLSTSLSFLSQLSAGLSLWPGGEGTYPGDATFFKDRTGWNFHGGVGIEYTACSRGSLVFLAAYNANFSTLDKIPVTIDMLLLSLGPQIRF